MIRATIKEERCPMKKKEERVKYTKEFKQDAINMVIDQGYSANEVGKRLGIGQSNVSRWVREYRADQKDIGEGEIPRKELETEIRRLKKENQRLQMEREILKKAAAFFAKESN
jgi:transposase